ncbi:hypothetical protein NAC57_000698 [Staphylococcus pseudintermedius]|nr:hypothetical protein [Staphylococcus pseudintermedius]
MRYVKSLITLLCVSGLCLLLGACGKSDDVVGNKYKAIFNNEVEAIVEFKDNGDLVYKVAEGAFDAGREEHGKYEVIEENGKKFLLTGGVHYSKFFNSIDGAYLKERDREGKIFLLQEKNKKLELLITHKKNSDSSELNSTKEIKDLEAIEGQNDTRILEKVD